MASDSKGITQFYLPPTHEPYLSLLPSCTASPPLAGTHCAYLRRHCLHGQLSHTRITSDTVLSGSLSVTKDKGSKTHWNLCYLQRPQVQYRLFHRRQQRCWILRHCGGQAPMLVLMELQRADIQGTAQTLQLSTQHIYLLHLQVHSTSPEGKLNMSINITNKMHHLLSAICHLISFFDALACDY